MAKDTEATLWITLKEKGSEVLEKLGSGLVALGTVAAVALAEVFAFGARAVQSYAEQELAVNSLNQTLIQQGIYSAALSKEYQNLASELQKKTTYGDEEIIQAQSVMQAYLGQTKITKELVMATLNLAAAKKTDLKTAAEMVGKSIGTSTNALVRQGVKLEEGTTKTERLAIVIKSLNQKFGGQAEAAAKGIGTFSILFHAIDEVFEAIGQRLQPVVVLVAQALTEMAQRLSENKGALSAVTTIIKLAAQAGVILYEVFVSIGQIMGAGLGVKIEALSQIMRGQFLAAIETVRAGAIAMKGDLLTNWNEARAGINAIDEAFLEKRQQNLSKEEEMLRISEENKRLLAEEAQIIKNEDFAVKSEEDIAKILAQEELKNNIQFQALQKEINDAKAAGATKTQLMELENKKRLMIEAAYQQKRYEMLSFWEKMESLLNEKKVKAFESSANYMSKMQDSKSRELVMIGKAAAIASITMDTAKAIMGVWAWTGAIPFVGMALGAALTAALVAYGAEQISRVNSAHMAQGGIVQATAGGTLATIGEAGRDEAVIPLEEGGPMLGNRITIVVNGGLLGDEASARELAIALDRQLLKLRQSNQSVAFDSGIV